MSTLTAPSVTRSSARRVAAAGAIGSVLEWYDYALYGAASALVIGPLFFPSLDPTAAQLASFATFAVGFAARPLGGVFFGWMGDRFGRKSILIFTVVLMGVVTGAMGLLPTYDQIGIAAPILIVLLRLIQGLGAGAEFAGALTYVSEGSETNKRAFRTAFTGSASVAGTFIATGVFALASALTSSDAFLAWGWRIPFLVGVLLIIPAIIVRVKLTDSPAFVKMQADIASGVKPARAKVPLFDMLRNDTRSFFSALLAPTILSVIAYLVTVFSVSYVVNSLKLPTITGLVMTLVATGVGMLAAPLFGLLADRIGSRKVMLIGAVFGLAFAFPYFALLQTGSVPIILIAATLNYAITWGAMAGGQGAFLPSLFRTRYRFTGVATARELNSAIFAGPAALIAGALLAAGGGHPWLVAVFVIAMSIVSIIGLFLGRPRPLMDGETAAR